MPDHFGLASLESTESFRSGDLDVGPFGRQQIVVSIARVDDERVRSILWSQRVGERSGKCSRNSTECQKDSRGKLHAYVRNEHNRWMGVARAMLRIHRLLIVLISWLSPINLALCSTMMRGSGKTLSVNELEVCSQRRPS